MENTNKTPKNIVGGVLLLIQLVAAVVLIGFIIKAGVFPTRYVVIAAVVLLLLLAAVRALGRVRKTAVRAIAAILSIFIIGMSIFGTVYVHGLDSTLSEISSTSEQQIESVIVIVRADDAADSLEDTAGYTYATAGTYDDSASNTASTASTAEDADQAAVSSVNREYLAQTVSDIEEQIGKLEIKQYESPVDACRALTDKDADAVICSSVYPSMMEDIDPGFSSAVKTVFTKEFETENTSAASSGAVADVTKDSFNVFISGIDVSGPISTVSRSDVNIIMTVNPVAHKILLTTTPRDYYVYIPGISGDKRDKLTHAGIYGINASMSTLENLYDINLNYYVRVNFDSLINIVDALGGIDVNSDYEFDSQNVKGYHFNKGTNHLDGKAALAFARDRYSFQSGDNQRGKNQEAVLTAIIEKMETSAVLTNAGEVMRVIQESAQTSISRDEMNRLIRYQISEMPEWDVESQSATGTGDMQTTYSMGSTQLYVMWPDEDAVKTLSENIKAVMKEN